jgi:hypothetical protein
MIALAENAAPGFALGGERVTGPAGLSLQVGVL